MGALTPRAGLYLPGTGSTGLIVPDEVADIDKLNDNFRKIDALLGARNIPSASSYGGNMDGDLVYAQDTEFLYMYSAAIGNLITPRLPGATRYRGTQAEMEAFKPSARPGDAWFNTTDNDPYLLVAGEWQPLTPHALVTKNSAQTTHATPSTFTPLVWNLENFDKGGLWKSEEATRFTVNQKGTYRVTAKSAISSTTAAVGVGISRNGTQLIRASLWSPASISGAYAQTSILIDLEDGDYVEALIAASAASIAVAAVNSDFSIFKVN